MTTFSTTSIGLISLLFSVTTLAKRGLGASLTQEDHDQMTSPPFFVGSRMYIRTHKFLWCIGGK